MAKVKLQATGGLNYDDDLNNVAQGDYIRANNIVFDTGADGGAGAIKMLEAISSTGVSFSGTVKATTQDPFGLIYVVVRTDNTTATIFRLNDTQTTASSILTYPHSVTTDFTPDIKVVGDMIVWNYCEAGNILTYSLKKYNGTSQSYSVSDLYLQKKTPNNVVSIKKNKTTNSGVALLQSRDFQFASRYQYESGEYSVLSNYSQMFKGEKDTSSYDISFNFSGTPAFVSTIETFVREGNNGTWRRIDTRSKGDTSAYSWTGQMYESLDAVTASKPFDAVPVNAKHIEVAKNRIFLANIQDDYEVTEANKKISISVSSGYTLGGGSSKMYGLSSVDATSSELSYDGSGYAKPFANNSVYAVGWAYYDEAMKTRGVEGFYKFNTGNFAYPFIPSVSLSPQGGYVKPSWAKYIQLVYTKNISKSYVFEGYASNVFFELNEKETDKTTGAVTTNKVFSQNVTKDQLKDVNYFIVDIMGMIRAGKQYVYEDGDKITINTVSGGVEKILDLSIVGQRDNFLYCNYNGSEMTCDEIPDPSKLYFEIYTPKQAVEDDLLVFYEYGNLVDISGGFSGITFSGGSTFAAGKLIGDMVFSKIELPTYKDTPFLYNLTKATPVDANTVANRTTIVNSSLTGGSMAQSSAGGVNSTYVASPVTRTLTFNSFTMNEDLAVIPTTGTSVRITGFYEAGRQTQGTSKLELGISYTYTNVLSIPPATATEEFTASINWGVTAQVYRTPYDNKENKKLPAVKFGNLLNAGNGTYTANGTQTGTFPSKITIDLNKIGQDINAKDEFWVELNFTFNASGTYNGASTTISALSAELVLVGNRTASKQVTTYNANVEMNETKTSFLIRSISNAVADPQWNTSSGKPTLSAKDPVSLVRTNAIRYSGNFVSGTKVNNINSFFALDSNEVPVENGDIMSLQRASRLQGNGSMLLALCKRESAYIFLGEQELTQGNNNSIRALTANFIGTIRNMGGMLGLQDKRSVLNYKGTIWFWDDFNKKVVKYNENGLDIPSNIKVKSAFLKKSGSARLAYDPYYNMCLVSVGNETQVLGYSERLQRWMSAYDFTVDFSESFGDKIIVFKNNSVYKSLQSGYDNFMGTATTSNIEFVLNSGIPILPQNIAIQHNCAVVDYSQPNNVKSSLLQVDIANENGQATSVKEANFLIEDNRLYGHVMRDVNSTGGIINGDYVVGYINKFLLTLKDRTQNMRVVSLDVELDYVSGHS